MVGAAGAVAASRAARPLVVVVVPVEANTARKMRTPDTIDTMPRMTPALPSLWRQPMAPNTMPRIGSGQMIQPRNRPTNPHTKPAVANPLLAFGSGTGPAG